MTTNTSNERSTIVGLLLFLFFANLGIHRFYFRKYVTGAIILVANVLSGILVSRFVGGILEKIFYLVWDEVPFAQAVTAGYFDFIGSFGFMLLLIIPILWGIGFGVWYFIDLYKIVTKKFVTEGSKPHSDEESNTVPVST